MHLLPDFLIIEFLDWLRNEKKETLIFGDRELLNERAQEFLKFREDDFEKNFKAILHRIIDLVKFDEYELHRLERLTRYKQISPHYARRELFSTLRRVIEFYEEKHDLQESNKIFDELCEYMSYKNVFPYELAESTYQVFMGDMVPPSVLNEQYKNTLNLMVQCTGVFGVEIDFLNWMQKNEKVICLDSLSHEIYKRIVEEFVSNLDVDSKKQIKEQLLELHPLYSNKKTLLARLERILFFEKNSDKRHVVTNLINRYCSDVYKCILILREYTKEENKKLFSDSWKDLNALSADYLDIYYTSTLTESSGYEISNSLRYLPDNLKGQAPMIVIWKDSLKKAEGIRIDGLNNEGIVSVIECIVGSIKENKNLAQIVKEADKKVKSTNEGNRVIMQKTTNINFSDGSSNNGIISTGDEAKITQSVSNEITNESIDFEAVKKVIAEFTDVEKKQRDDLISILCRIETAVQNNDKEKQEEEKKSFKNVINSIGKCAFKLLATMDSVAGILSFLDFSIS